MKAIIAGRQWSETPNEENVLVKRLVGVQITIINADGNPIGNVSVSEWNGSFSMDTSITDVQKIADAVAKVLIK